MSKIYLLKSTCIEDDRTCIVYAENIDEAIVKTIDSNDSIKFIRHLTAQKINKGFIDYRYHCIICNFLVGYSWCGDISKEHIKSHNKEEIKEALKEILKGYIIEVDRIIN